MAPEITPQTFNYLPLIILIINIIISAIVGFISAWVKIKLSEQRIVALEKSDDNNTKKLTDLCEKVAELKGGLERDRHWMKRESPWKLTDEGKKALSESGGKHYIDHNAITLIEEIQSHKPKTAYDVQEISRKILNPHTDDDAFIPIKNFAFNHGENLKNILDIMGIYLRDIALKKLNFNISDIKE